MKRLLIGLLVAGLMVFSVPALVMAQQGGTTGPSPASECQISQNVQNEYPNTCSCSVWSTQNDNQSCQPICCLLSTIDTIGTWFFWIVLSIAFIMLLWGAIMFITAGGSGEQTESAQQTLIYALVGVAVAYFSQLLVDMVSHLLV